MIRFCEIRYQGVSLGKIMGSIVVLGGLLPGSLEKCVGRRA